MVIVEWQLFSTQSASHFIFRLLCTGWKHHEVSTALWKCHLDNREQGDNAKDDSTEWKKRGEQRKTRRRRRRGDAHYPEKEQHGWQLKWSKDCVTLCGTVELHGRHLKSMVTNHHWCWKMSFTLKPFIWHLSIYLVPVSLVCRCHYCYLDFVQISILPPLVAFSSEICNFTNIMEQDWNSSSLEA